MLDPSLQALIEKVTLVGGLVWAVLALVRGWVVPRSVYDALRADRDDWRTRSDKLAAVAEMTLRAKVGGS